ncbi:SGNH/GDSL hydrolase family protein [Nocardia brasiliensis]|uniref:SGNH/GDSL hydrolase family protein n=1 Tax=Nocardia brasiliensis TaxID=37326 RepID=UPI001892E24C|nr:SGNH/GDSL hydrolase family protein [Nocardia brasiliensis]MBF6546895.1 SGNH/GDSL hydrolase family protein [Nocardia brasiliensis]
MGQHTVRWSAALATAIALAAAPAAAQPTAPAYREYVSLGDSFTADVLTAIPPTTEFAPFNCDQSATNYPRLVAAALSVPVFHDASCGGAKTADLTAPQTVPLGTNPPQLDRLTRTTDLVTLSIGGNDLGLQELIPQCLSPAALLPGLPAGDGCAARLTAAGGDPIETRTRATEPEIAATIDRIRQRAPHARILLVNYLDALPATGCVPELPATDVDAAYLRAKLVRLNTMLAHVAANTGVQLVDTFAATAGHDVCRAPEVRYVEGLLPFSARNPQLVAFPFHPNAAGAQAQARAVLDAIGRPT